MTIATEHATGGRWMAELVTLRQLVPMKETTKEGDTRIVPKYVRSFLVEFTRPGREPIQFKISHRKEGCRITFCDDRERSTGTAGSTGRGARNR